MDISVGIIMGSRSDWSVMAAAADMLDALGIPYEAKVVSAHRTPDHLYAAHLPGMCAAMTPLPVLGVPVAATVLNGADAMLSIAQMPKGVPVATFAIGQPGAANAALFAAAMLANNDSTIAAALDRFREEQTASVPEEATA